MWPVSSPLRHPLPPLPHVRAPCQIPLSLSCCPATLPTGRLPAATLMELRNSEADSHGDSPAPNGFSKDTLNLWKNSAYTINPPPQIGTESTESLCFIQIYFPNTVSYALHVGKIKTHTKDTNVQDHTFILNQLQPKHSRSGVLLIPVMYCRFEQSVYRITFQLMCL